MRAAELEAEKEAYRQKTQQMYERLVAEQKARRVLLVRSMVLLFSGLGIGGALCFKQLKTDMDDQQLRLDGHQRKLDATTKYKERKPWKTWWAETLFPRLVK